MNTRVVVAGVLGAAALLLVLRERITCLLSVNKWHAGRCVGFNRYYMRAELEENLKSLAMAERSYQAAYDEFVSCDEPTPRPIAELDVRVTAWVERECWKKLGWAPDGLVRGTYWVEVSDDGTSFVARGAIDTDKNGVALRAHVDGEGEFVYDNPAEL